MYLIFYKTTDVFLMEERLSVKGICVKVVPTPVQDKAYCGISLKLKEDLKDVVEPLLHGVEYKIVD